jgi:hypothetical protein
MGTPDLENVRVAVVVIAAIAVTGVQLIRWLRANGGVRLVIAWMLVSLVGVVAMSIVPELLLLAGHSQRAWDAWMAESAVAALACAAMQVAIWQDERCLQLAIAAGHHAGTSSSSARSRLKVVRSITT